MNWGSLSMLTRLQIISLGLSWWMTGVVRTTFPVIQIHHTKSSRSLPSFFITLLCWFWQPEIFRHGSTCLLVLSSGKALVCYHSYYSWFILQKLKWKFLCSWTVIYNPILYHDEVISCSLTDACRSLYLLLLGTLQVQLYPHGSWH